MPGQRPFKLSAAFGLEPERAIEYAQSRGLKVSENLAETLANVRARAFTVTGVTKADVLENLKTWIENGLKSGKPFSQTIDEIRPKLQAKGWYEKEEVNQETGEITKSGLSPSRLKLIYRQNTQTAMMAARKRAEDENADARPYRQYLAVIDGVTRESHKEMHGRVFWWDDPIWEAWYPPVGLYCRCWTMMLSQKEADALGFPVSVSEEVAPVMKYVSKAVGYVPVRAFKIPGVENPVAPDPGFDCNPADGFGVDVALARNIHALKTLSLRQQVWDALNQSPKRHAAWGAIVDTVVASRGETLRPSFSRGMAAIGFMNETILAFAQRMRPDIQPVRVLAMPYRRLAHADDVKHLRDEIVLTSAQYKRLPEIIAKPDDVFWDKRGKNDALIYVRYLPDGSAIYVPVELNYKAQHIGRIDALVNAYRLPKDGENGVSKLKNRKRFTKMGEEP